MIVGARNLGNLITVHISFYSVRLIDGKLEREKYRAGKYSHERFLEISERGRAPDKGQESVPVLG